MTLQVRRHVLPTPAWGGPPLRPLRLPTSTRLPMPGQYSSLAQQGHDFHSHGN
jgi:hypothetical protein